MKKTLRTVSEYVSKISDDDLRFVTSRLVEQYSGDMPDVLNFMSRNSDIDHYLSASIGIEDFYLRCDSIKDFAVKEAKKRNLQVGVAL